MNKKKTDLGLNSPPCSSLITSTHEQVKPLNPGLQPKDLLHNYCNHIVLNHSIHESFKNIKNLDKDVTFRYEPCGTSDKHDLAMEALHDTSKILV